MCIVWRMLKQSVHPDPILQGRRISMESLRVKHILTTIFEAVMQLDALSAQPITALELQAQSSHQRSPTFTYKSFYQSH